MNVRYLTNSKSKIKRALKNTDKLFVRVSRTKINSKLRNYLNSKKKLRSKREIRKREIRKSDPDPADRLPCGERWVREELPPRLVPLPRVHTGQPVELQHPHPPSLPSLFDSSPCAHYSRLFFRALAAYTMEGARGRRRRRRTSREPEPSVLRISQSPLRGCAGTSVRGNCRVPISPVTVRRNDRSP